ncbi:MAG: succinate dehydrogenase flavoprotein subunit [Armatimonadota bacterium]|nr:succinate dehydrogenase flavoprotein subunit [Armatimonadota bacterium]MDR7454513.1 succinate dehydrogenase flavoprotein subunit [Armatimonadota bacterium]MDR7456734.1 succinate dehydrogenase flavoprotein subunit [Armatimonadota bacterium]MDR7497448.1 succinate dehydrogenase flavoprotein subunit [Armatimonadota bacterium]MDR7510466.1 succinate dehydrogenase flavoprotein subunit [Armatimonadota bacterium]
MEHRHDAIIVGGGGAGLYAALELARHPGLRVAVVSKLHPVRSHTGAAQGGIGAALGHAEEDHPEWHMFDTVKGGDWLADQDAVELMCLEAIDIVYELERLGLPFDRAADGRIEQRIRAGGHTRNFGERPLARTLYAADRTGQMILYTLYQQCVRHRVEFYDEVHAIDLMLADGRCAGVVAWEMRTGEVHVFRASTVLLATGGWGQIYKTTTNAVSLTGDGVAMALRRGVPLEDMEFYQFHPTGIYKMGILLSEASRGEGVYLLNGEGERFMRRYAPVMGELAPRDLVSRCIHREIREGRGAGPNRDCAHLDFRHLPEEVRRTKLPEVVELIETYLGLDPGRDLIPVRPTAHYAVGGIPTDTWGRVVLDERNTPLPGLYAAGECACVSVHGANRLGTNSLVDILVFGRRAGQDMARAARDLGAPPAPGDAAAEAVAPLRRLLEACGGESATRVREELRQTMDDLASVFRTDAGLREALGRIADLRERYARVALADRGRVFNQELIEAYETGCLLDVAEATVASALYRTESRGTHFREDHPARDDAHWLVHTLCYRSAPGEYTFRRKPVVITRFPPAERTY